MNVCEILREAFSAPIAENIPRGLSDGLTRRHPCGSCFTKNCALKRG